MGGREGVRGCQSQVTKDTTGSNGTLIRGPHVFHLIRIRSNYVYNVSSSLQLFDSS